MVVRCIDGLPSMIPHMEPLDAEEFPKAVTEVGGAPKHHDRALSASLARNDVPMAIVDRKGPGRLPIIRHPVFANMPAEVQIAIGRHGVSRSAPSGELIPSADEVMFITSGAMTTLAAPIGPLVELIGPGDVRGLEAGLEGGKRPAMTALLDCQWIGLAPEHFREPGRPDGLTRLYAHQSLDRQRAMVREVGCFAKHSLERRAPELVLRLSAAAGDPTVRVGQAQIAIALGVVRTSLAVTTGRLQHEGLIKIGRGWIRILDAPALRRRACGCWSDHDGPPGGERTPHQERASLRAPANARCGSVVQRT